MQEQQLLKAFELCNGHKDCLDRLVHEFGGMFKEGQVSKQLKAMGLARGKLTPSQVRLGGSDGESWRVGVEGCGRGRGNVSPRSHSVLQGSGWHVAH